MWRELQNNLSKESLLSFATFFVLYNSLVYTSFDSNSSEAAHLHSFPSI